MVIIVLCIFGHKFKAGAPDLGLTCFFLVSVGFKVWALILGWHYDRRYIIRMLD